MIRKLATITLLVAFLLPLTKCTSLSQDGVPSDDYEYPFENIADAVTEVRAGGDEAAGSIILGILTMLVFFLPAALIRLSLKTQSVIHIVIAGPSLWVLYHWTTVGDPQLGGILAMLSWSALLCSAVMALWSGRVAA